MGWSGLPAAGGWPVAAMAAALGACLGSFANVLVYRLPRDLEWVRSRSFCPACGERIAWHDNVPVLGWLALRGRCRRCAAAISPRYPLVEAAGAAAGLLAWLLFGPTAAGVAALLLWIDLLAVALIDWEHMIIPHTLTVGGIALGLALSPWTGLGLARAALGLALGAGAILALSWGWRLVRGVAGMGGGDVVLMGMVGAFLGPIGVVLVLFGGSLLGTLYILVRLRGRIDGQAKLPFGTFLAAAAALAVPVGDPLVRWYFGLMG